MANKIKLSLLTITAIISLSMSWVLCAQSVVPIPPEQAFILTVETANPEQAFVNIDITPGYYLYKDRLRISANEKNIKVSYPQGTYKYFMDRGRVEVYEKKILIPVSVPAKTASMTLHIDYQGCSAASFCYPPEHKDFNLNFRLLKVDTVEDHAAITPSGKTSLSALLTDQNKVRSLLDTEHLGVLLLVFLGLGLLLAFTPCVLPMIPILTSLIIGQGAVNTRKAFLLSFSYVIGASLMYAVAGMLAATLGGLLQVWIQQPWVIGLGSLLFALFALSLFNVYHLRAPRFVQHHLTLFSNKQQGGTYLGVFIMGMISALIISPCVTAPLVGVLIYIGQTGDKVLGAAALFVMGLGMGIPLMLIGMTAGKWLPRRGPWMEGIKHFFGILMLGMSLWLLSRIISPVMTTIVGNILLVAAIISIGFYLPAKLKWKGAKRNISYGVMAGSLLLALSINIPNAIMVQRTVPSAQFQIVHSVADLKAALHTAKAQKKMVLLDYYADWCESCVSMDRKVFNEPTTQAQLKNFVLLRADITENSPNDETLLKNYHVIAPPTVLFFNHDGHELNAMRIVGEVDASEFQSRLNSVKSTSCQKKLEC